ncbi:nucleotide sugar dehydrogenase [Cellulosilyticum ruminicola]|uniref:nucleotide sugar dehydrogenase n=1 Tax=Cellulosilyticum ruminicola TaxID=425254 RepID=UPI0006D25965|nr:nucleotide sugar dehydrogenase [Cellulosilyticum ruminicola]
MDFIDAIKNRQIKIAVIGLGYVGLPLSMALTKAGYYVQGIDCNAQRVESINNGHSNIIDVKDECLQESLKNDLFNASTEYSLISNVQAIIICVPTPLNKAKEPDLSYIIKAMKGVLPYLTKQILISLESTTYPGTTEELIEGYVEKEKGWKVGEDFYVCYSPERVDPGNKKFSVENTPKVIGGSTQKCLQIGQTLYESFLPKVVGVKTTRVAEMTKVLENTFRCVNIALVNEMTMMCERMGIDIWEVIKGASSKPFGFMPFYPGPGVGGHCIPLDPLYLSWEAKKYNYFNRFIETASDINSNMPYYVVHQIGKILCQQGKSIRKNKILLLGMSYKKDISDLRESPSLEVYELLKKQGASVEYYDPYIESFNYKDKVIKGIVFNEETIKQFDIVVLLSDHSNIDYNWLVEKATLIYDTRNVCKDIENHKIIKLGQNIEGMYLEN